MNSTSSTSPPASTFDLQEGSLLTVAQALKLLPISKTLLYDLVKGGDIASVKIASAGSRSGRLLILRSSLEDFVRRQITASAAPRPAARLDLDSIVSRHRRAS